MTLVQAQAPAAPPPASSPVGAIQEAAAPVVAAPTAAQMYQAQRALRTELLNQHQRLLDSRLSIARRLRTDGSEAVTGADRTGLETRLQELDARIVDMEKQIAQADASVAQAAGVPGAIVPPPPRTQTGPPEEFFVFGGLVLIAAILPLSIGIARRIMSRGKHALSPKVAQEMSDRLTRLEQAVDTVAVEVERIGEGQRFVTNLFIESGAPLALGAGAMQPVEVRQQHGVPVESRERAN